MKSVFLDSSVLVAACGSKIGASAFILGHSKQGKLNAFVSRDVVNEARKNISLKIGKTGLDRLWFYIKSANLRLFPSPSIEKIAECEKYINKKDASILAAALESEVSFIITLDRKHFLQPQVIQFVKPTIIILPGEFVENYLRK